MRGSTVINKNEINTTNDLEFQYEDVTRKLDKKLKNPLAEPPQIPDTRHPTPGCRLTIPCPILSSSRWLWWLPMFVESIRPGDIKTRFSVTLYCCCSSRFCFLYVCFFCGPVDLLQPLASAAVAKKIILLHNRLQETSDSQTDRRNDQTKNSCIYTLHRQHFKPHSVKDFSSL